MNRKLYLVVTIFSFLICILFSTPSSAGVNYLTKWAVDGEVVCGEGKHQAYPYMVPDGKGNAIIYWHDYRNTPATGYTDLYVQKIDSNALSLWAPEGVAVCNSRKVSDIYPTYLYRNNCAMISDGKGGLIITWEDHYNGNADIYAQRVDATGKALWGANGKPICINKAAQCLPKITSDGKGGAIIAWEDKRNLNLDIYAQRVDANGNLQWAADTPVCINHMDQAYLDIIADSSGGAIIAWVDWRGGPTHDIYAQRVDASGKLLWSADLAVTKDTFKQQSVDLVPDGKGGAIAVWLDLRTGYPQGDIYAQRIHPNAYRLWSTSKAICSDVYNQTSPIAISDNHEGAIVVWEDGRNVYEAPDIYAQRIDGKGNGLWVRDGIPICTAKWGQFLPTLAPDGMDGAIITWHDYRNIPGTIQNSADIYAQRVDAAGNIQWKKDGMSICTNSIDQSIAHVVSDNSYGAFIAWNDASNKVDVDIYAQRIVPDGIVNPVNTVTIYTKNRTGPKGKKKNNFLVGKKIVIEVEATSTNPRGLSTVTIKQTAGINPFTWKIGSEWMKSRTITESIYKEPGTYTFKAIAEDMDGNIKETKLHTITVSEPWKQATAIFLTPSFNCVLGTTVEPIWFEATSNIGLTEVRVEQTGPVNYTEYYSTTNNVYANKYIPKLTTLGDYTLKVYAKDKDKKESALTLKSQILIKVRK